MWFWYALISAFFGTAAALLSKKTLEKVSAPLLTWSLFALSLPFLVVLLIKDGWPETSPLFFIGVFGSAALFSIGKTMTNAQLKVSLLSKLYPLTAFASVFQYVLGVLFLGETPTLIQSIGLMFIILGVYVLNAEGVGRNIIKPFQILLSDKPALIYLFAIFLASSSAVFDKIGLSHTQPTNTTAVLFAENVLMTLFLAGYMMKKDTLWIGELGKHFFLLLLNAIIYLVLVLFVFQGFISGPVVLVMGVNRLQILFVLLFGMVFLGDKPTKHTWIAAILMILGTLLSKIG